ncbi:MAG: 2-C-methyl-D-erythritol 2,4-cyclodiphosphate synthase [Candidatus Krumholzibacteriota bacterium]|nr:2-C-methyl-D-erythritol 2,4-cyclodiphosphate synthase [Candidatus Krumholzibacteriota bacterium]
MRIGIGYDIHPLVKGRPLILGGVEIESERGPAGHSDADALLHAVCDALLGALSLGDLGEHFPESDEFKGISSLVLVQRVGEMIAGRDYRVVNLDCIVHAERPRLSGYRKDMIAKIAGALGIDAGDVSVKFTRGEGLGPVGEERALAARAVVLLEKISGGG